MLIAPHSNGEDNRPISSAFERRLLREFNPNHYPGGSAKGGQFAPKQGGQFAAAHKSEQRGDVIRVSSVSKAVKLILEGKNVELTSVRKVNTVLTKLAAMARDAKARGEDAPNYDLCKVSVAGTNLFCGSKLRTKEFPDGVPRLHMPQFGGEPRKGSRAAQIPRDEKGHVDVAQHFVSYLQESLHIKTKIERVPAALLKASQSELIGAKVAKMMTNPKFDAEKHTVFISRDNYVVDGHHRWAAVVGKDTSNNRLGDLKMRVTRIDAPISEVLHIANKWTRRFGIKPKSGK